MAAFIAMRSVHIWDPLLLSASFHFYVVSATTFLAAVIGASLMISLESVRQTRTVFLALGFVALAMIFAVHGLGTPGFIITDPEYSYPVVVSAGLSEIVASLFIFASVLPAYWLPKRGFDRWRPVIVAGALAALGAYVVVSLTHPEVWSFVPRERPWDTALAVPTMLLLAYAAWRYFVAWRLTRFPAQFAMVAALVLLAESQVSMYYGTIWRADWWLYHLLMLTAFSTLVAGWALEARRAKSLVLFSRAFALHDTLDHVRLSRPETLEALDAAMATKDEYTRDHMGRVAVYATAIARELGCDPLTLSLVEAAARIHDIGKIAVPDAVLLKPASLTPREFEQMKHHAERGAHIARSSKVLLPVAHIVRAHHERFAGGGYPDGLSGDRIPLAARIVAVADTFDALTTPRVYRGARPLAEAIAEVRRVAGVQLDPRCVAAFLAWHAREGEALDLAA